MTEGASGLRAGLSQAGGYRALASAQVPAPRPFVCLRRAAVGFEPLVWLLETDSSTRAILHSRASASLAVLHYPAPLIVSHAVASCGPTTARHAAAAALSTITRRRAGFQSLLPRRLVAPSVSTAACVDVPFAAPSSNNCNRGARVTWSQLFRRAATRRRPEVSQPRFIPCDSIKEAPPPPRAPCHAYPTFLHLAPISTTPQAQRHH